METPNAGRDRDAAIEGEEMLPEDGAISLHILQRGFADFRRGHFGRFFVGPRTNGGVLRSGKTRKRYDGVVGNYFGMFFGHRRHFRRRGPLRRRRFVFPSIVVSHRLRHLDHRVRSLSTRPRLHVHRSFAVLRRESPRLDAADVGRSLYRFEI